MSEVSSSPAGTIGDTDERGLVVFELLNSSIQRIGTSSVIRWIEFKGKGRIVGLENIANVHVTRQKLPQICKRVK